MKYDYEPLDMAEIATEADRVSAEPGSQNNNFLEDWRKKYVVLPERDGFVTMRILPRRKGQKLFCATRTHRLINPSVTLPNGQHGVKNLHCPKTLVTTDKGPRWQGECIICKYYNDLWQKSEKLSGKAQEDLQNKAREIKPVERYYYNVIVRQEKDKRGAVVKNVGPKIYSCGKTVHAKIVRAMVGDKAAGEDPLGDVTHPVDGRDFKLVKKVVKGSGGKEYPSYDTSKFEPVAPLGDPDQVNDWLTNSWDLTLERVIKPEDELKRSLKIHLGLIKEEAATDDLAEFRGDVDNASDTVREELCSPSPAATTPEPTAPAVKEDSGSESLADDDFMKELSELS